MMTNTMEIVRSVISARIEHCQCTIESNKGDDNIGVRISAMAKIVMLEEILKDIETKVKQ